MTTYNQLNDIEKAVCDTACAGWLDVTKMEFSNPTDLHSMFHFAYDAQHNVMDAYSNVKDIDGGKVAEAIVSRYNVAVSRLN